MAHRQVTSFNTEEAVGLMDAGGVDAAVIHPPGWDPKSTEMAFQEPMRGWLADGTLDWLWAAAERASVPIAMLATDSLPHIAWIAERHPGLRLTIDHLGGRGGNTTLKDDAAMEHMPALISWPSIPMSPSRRPVHQATTPSGPRVCSGEPTSRRCRAPG